MINLFILNSELEHLEICSLVLNRRRELRLPNLRVLSIHSLVKNYPIVLDLPKLSKLLISGNFNIQYQFLRPTSVTHLALGRADFVYPDELIQHFQECQYLHF